MSAIAPLTLHAPTIRSSRLPARLRAVDEPSDDYTPVLGNPGTCSGKPVRHIVLNDRSASLGGAGVGGADPIGLRYLSLLRAVEKIATSCRCRKEELELISFDLRSSFDLAPTPMHKKSIGKIRSALTTEDRGCGISTLAPAIAEATTSLDGFRGRSTLTVFSDWFLTDTEQAVADLLALEVDHLHVVALSAPAPSGISESAQVTVTEASWSDDPALVAEAVFEVFVAQRKPPRTRGGVRR